MKNNKLYIILLICCCIVSSFIGVTSAWFYVSEQDSINMTPGSLSDAIIINTFFTKDGNVTVVDENSEFYKNGVLVIEAGKEVINAEKNGFIDNDRINYIDNFSMNITINSPISAFFRVKALHTIIRERRLRVDDTVYDRSMISVPAGSSSTFKTSSIDENWAFDVDSRYYYYTKPVEKKTEYDIHFIEGGSSQNVTKNSLLYYENYIYNLTISVEIVQANRYLQYWSDIDAIPEAGTGIG